MIDFDEVDFEWYFQYLDAVRIKIWQTEYINNREKITKENIDIDEFVKFDDKWQVYWSVEIPVDGKTQIEVGMVTIPTYEEWKLELIAKHRDNALKVLGI
jgi:hypothetical protein